MGRYGNVWAVVLIKFRGAYPEEYGEVSFGEKEFNSMFSFGMGSYKWI